VKILVSLLLPVLFAFPPVFKPGPKVPVQVQSPQESAARAVLANINAGRFEAATKDFDAAMKTTVPPSLLAEMKKQFDQELGTFQLVTGATTQVENGLPTVELMVRYSKSLAAFKVAFDETGRISSVYFNRIVPDAVDPALEATARELLADFVAGRFDDARKNFNSTLTALMTPAALADMSKQVGDVFGTFHTVTGVLQRNGKDFRAIELTTVYDEGRVLALVIFDKTGHVSGMRISPWKAHPETYVPPPVRPTRRR